MICGGIGGGGNQSVRIIEMSGMSTTDASKPASGSGQNVKNCNKGQLLDRRMLQALKPSSSHATLDWQMRYTEDDELLRGMVMSKWEM